MRVPWGHPYGGVLLAQAYAAAAATVPGGREVRSMHAYFIDVGRDDVGVDLEVTVVRDGRRSCWRSVDLVQKGRLLLTAELLFSAEREGPGHQAPMPEVPSPERLSNAGTDLTPFLDDTFRPWDTNSPFDLRYVTTPLRLAAEGTEDPGDARSQVWTKAAAAVDDPILATALLVYASDLCMVDPCLVPHGLWFGPGSATGLSLDHSIWFHQPARIDDWIFMDLRSPAMSHGRGLGQADMYAVDGELLCSVAQLGSIRVTAPPVPEEASLR